MRRVSSFVRSSKLTAQRENSNTCCHFALNIHGHFKNELLDALHSARLHNRKFVLLGTRRQVAEGGDGMTLDFFVVLERQ